LEKRERVGKKRKKVTDMLLKGMFEKREEGKEGEKEPKRLTTPISLGRNRRDPLGVPPL
jgi:hypothetical protein